MSERPSKPVQPRAPVQPPAPIQPRAPVQPPAPIQPRAPVPSGAPARGVVFALPPPRLPLNVPSADVRLDLQGGRDRIESNLPDPSQLVDEGAAIDVVGSNGKLNKVPKHSTWVTPTAYPTQLHVVNGETSVRITSDGVQIMAASGYICNITFAAITRDCTLREIDICNGGTPAHMLVLGSAPY